MGEGREGEAGSYYNCVVLYYVHLPSLFILLVKLCGIMVFPTSLTIGFKNRLHTFTAVSNEADKKIVSTGTGPERKRLPRKSKMPFWIFGDSFLFGYDQTAGTGIDKWIRCHNAVPSLH